VTVNVKAKATTEHYSHFAVSVLFPFPRVFQFSTSQLVEEAIQWGQVVCGRERLAGANREDELARLARRHGGLDRVALDDLPVVKDALRKRLAASGGAERAGEAAELAHDPINSNFAR
jgi:hypothetical protein